MNKKLLPLLILLIISMFSYGCQRPTGNSSNDANQALQKQGSDKIGKVIFYLENSESMFGYINGYTEYVDVVSELAEKPDFAEERTPREFFFINGGEKLVITPIGDEPSLLKNKLNITGFNCGDITKSNLNSMFQIAMEKAKDDTISILISDAIYDVGHQNKPHNALQIEGRETRSRFIERLGEGELQTIIIKLHSQFNGNYFPVTGGRINLNQTRPFYIWIFGNTSLLNKYFPEKYISSLEGFSEMARFLKFDSFIIPFQITPLEKLGDFKFDKSNKNKLIKAKSLHNKFQFSFAVDLTSLPFSESYKQDKDNYTINGNYSIKEVKEIEKKLFGIPFNPSHLITVSTERSPYNSELLVSLKNVAPQWINESHTENESNIQNDTTRTVGFKFLTDGINEAYEHMNGDNKLATFTFEITK